MDPSQVTPRDVVPHWEEAVARCVQQHRLPSRQIPCVECQQAVASHERHSPEREFDLSCDQCQARASKKIRANVRAMLLTEGLTEEQADEFFVDMDRLIAKMKAERGEED